MAKKIADAAYVQKPFGSAEVTAMPYNAFATSGQKMFARLMADPLVQSARPEWCGAIREMSADVETLMLPKPTEKNTGMANAATTNGFTEKSANATDITARPNRSIPFSKNTFRTKRMKKPWYAMLVSPIMPSAYPTAF